MTEVPEGDALEQTMPLDPDEDDEELFPSSFGDEVPEADAVEQAMPVPLDDEDWE